MDKKLVVDNDGRHGTANKCSAADLDEGQHSLRVEFFRADGSAYIEATYRSSFGLGSGSVPPHCFDC